MSVTSPTLIFFAAGVFELLLLLEFELEDELLLSSDPHPATTSMAPTRQERPMS
jgi:hypothetical protein